MGSMVGIYRNARKKYVGMDFASGGSRNTRAGRSWGTNKEGRGVCGKKSIGGSDLDRRKSSGLKEKEAGLGEKLSTSK